MNRCLEDKPQARGGLGAAGQPVSTADSSQCVHPPWAWPQGSRRRPRPDPRLVAVSSRSCCGLAWGLQGSRAEARAPQTQPRVGVPKCYPGWAPQTQPGAGVPKHSAELGSPNVIQAGLPKHSPGLGSPNTAQSWGPQMLSRLGSPNTAQGWGPQTQPRVGVPKHSPELGSPNVIQAGLPKHGQESCSPGRLGDPGTWLPLTCPTVSPGPPRRAQALPRDPVAGGPLTEAGA